MRFVNTLSLAVAFAVVGVGCSTPKVANPHVPPPRVSVPIERSAEPRFVPMNEDATDAFLEEQIERRQAHVTPAVPLEPPAPEVVERVVYYRDVPASAYDYPGPYRPRPSTFPINTALGAGLGAIIGHQSDHRDEGAAIGAGVGLLLDVWR